MAVESHLDEAAKNLEAAITAGLKAGADLLLQKSNQLVPVAVPGGGALRATGVAAAQGREAAVGYTSPYAIKHHQRMDFRHKKGQAKYLATAYLANVSSIEEAIGKKIGEALE